MFSALLDTCVLVPSFLRDLLLELAASQSYRPVWSNRIEEELQRVLADLWEKRGIPSKQIEARLERLLHQMNRAFPDARLVIPSEAVTPLLELPDPNDLHVVTAALLGRADVIVTKNLKDFPSEFLPGELRSISADDFLLDTYDLFPNQTWEAIKRICDRSGKAGQSLIFEDFSSVSNVKNCTGLFVFSEKNEQARCVAMRGRGRCGLAPSSLMEELNSVCSVE